MSENQSTRLSRIEQLLQNLPLEQIHVLDESSQHAGHAGASPSGETHYRLVIRSAYLKSLSRVAAQRIINQALANEFATGLHALAIEING